MALAEPAAAAWTDDALATLNDWSVAEWLRRSLYAYPIVNVLHILGFILLIGGIILVDLRVLGAFRRVPFAVFGRIHEPMAALGLLLAIVAGFLLFAVKPADYAENISFQVKMVLVLLGIVNAVTQRFGRQWRPAMADDMIIPRMRVQAALSIGIWLSVLVAGRFIAFLE